MNVSIKPLVWSCECPGRFDAKTSFGRIGVVVSAFGKWFLSAHMGMEITPGQYDTADAAKLAAERWYTLKVTDCLEPADQDAALAMLSMRDQYMGLCD